MIVDHTPVRIIVVDKHKAMRRTLGLFLGQYEHIDLVGEASDGAEALAVCERTHPDVVLMDVLMRGIDGAMATQTIRRAFPMVHVIGMTGMEPDRIHSDPLKAGADNVIYKGALFEGLLPAIDEVMSVEPSFPPTYVHAA
jgi:DNA-binding NarL/FixJ family response regulator